MTRGDEAVALTATEFSLLRYFMLNPRRVLSKAQILQNVWRYDFGGNSNVVETYVSYLRRKLDATGATADQDGPPGRLHARRAAGVIGRLSLRARLILGVIVLAAVGARRGRRRHLHRAALVPLPARRPVAAGQPRARRLPRRPRRRAAHGPPVQALNDGDRFARLVSPARVDARATSARSRTLRRRNGRSTGGLSQGDDGARYDTVPAQSGGGRFRVRTSSSSRTAQFCRRPRRSPTSTRTLRRLCC